MTQSLQAQWTWRRTCREQWQCPGHPHQMRRKTTGCTTWSPSGIPSREPGKLWLTGCSITSTLQLTSCREGSITSESMPGMTWAFPNHLNRPSGKSRLKKASVKKKKKTRSANNVFVCIWYVCTVKGSASVCYIPDHAEYRMMTKSISRLLKGIHWLKGTGLLSISALMYFFILSETFSLTLPASKDCCFETPPSFSVPLKMHNSPERYECYMSCAVTGNPRPHVTWYRNNISLNTNTNYYITNTCGVCSMMILKVGPKDSGNYTVVAESPLGRVECSTKLVVKGTTTLLNLHH